MGEYAKHKGEQIKIGTCGDMYYLRADQRHLVQPVLGNVHPADPTVLPHIRFCFPWPDEDKNEPGSFERYDRGLGVCGRRYRLDPENGECLSVAIRSMADKTRNDDRRKEWLHEVARRVMAGYAESVAA